MNPTQRQTLLLIGFMTLLTVTFLFLFVYAEERASLPTLDLSLIIPEPADDLINRSVTGWERMIETFQTIGGEDSPG